MNESAIKQMSDRQKAMLSSGGNYALQGATTGASIGGPWGAVIGGVGGALYGAYKAGETYDDEQETLAKETETASKTAAEADKIKREKELDEVVKNSMVTSDPAVQPDIATLNISNTGSALGQISKVMMKKQLAPIESRYTNLKQSAMEANRGNMFMKMSGASDIAKLSAAQSAELDMDKDGDIDAGDLKAKRQSNVTQQEYNLPPFTVTYSSDDERKGVVSARGQKGVSTTRPLPENLTLEKLDTPKPKTTKVNQIITPPPHTKTIKERKNPFTGKRKIIVKEDGVKTVYTTKDEKKGRVLGGKM